MAPGRSMVEARVGDASVIGMEEFMKQLIGAGIALVLAICGDVSAAPVVYTAYAATDGQLGALKFEDARVVITFQGDTRDVKMNTSGGVSEYRIDKGNATIAVTVQGTTTVAQINSGQIYVHYDVQSGVVGFGSETMSNPYYPLTLACYHPYSYCYYDANGNAFASNQIVSALAEVEADPADSTSYSARVDATPQTLTKSTLLTGYANACAVPYTFQAGSPPCASPAPAPINTSLGDLYIQDQTLSKAIFTVQVGSTRED